MEQELLFVGTENGKLLAMRDIIKKVRPLQEVSVQACKNGFCIRSILNYIILHCISKLSLFQENIHIDT